MFYTVKLTNSLYRPSVFLILDAWEKVYKIINFWFIVTWNNIDQFQQNGSCTQIMYGCIWVGKIKASLVISSSSSVLANNSASLLCTRQRLRHSPLPSLVTPPLSSELANDSASLLCTRHQLHIPPLSLSSTTIPFLCYSAGSYRIDVDSSTLFVPRWSFLRHGPAST